MIFVYEKLIWFTPKLWLFKIPLIILLGTLQVICLNLHLDYYRIYLLPSLIFTIAQRWTGGTLTNNNFCSIIFADMLNSLKTANIKSHKKSIYMCGT